MGYVERLIEHKAQWGRVEYELGEYFNWFSNGCLTEQWRAVGSTPCVGEWTDWRDENEQQASKMLVVPLPFALRGNYAI